MQIYFFFKYYDAKQWQYKKKIKTNTLDQYTYICIYLCMYCLLSSLLAVTDIKSIYSCSVPSWDNERLGCAAPG